MTVFYVVFSLSNSPPNHYAKYQVTNFEVFAAVTALKQWMYLDTSSSKDNLRMKENGVSAGGLGGHQALGTIPHADQNQQRRTVLPTTETSSLQKGENGSPSWFAQLTI